LFLLLEMRSYWRGFVPEGTGSTRFCGIELGKVGKREQQRVEETSNSKAKVGGRILKKVIQVGSEILMLFHSIIHQEALCCQVSLLGDVMDILISAVICIQCSGLTHRQFQKFLEEI
jgi:hypothetical protein